MHLKRTRHEKLVEKPKDKEVIGVKWVYKVKHNPDGFSPKEQRKTCCKGLFSTAQC